MNNPPLTPHDVSGLNAAISLNREDGATLARLLEPHQWSVLVGCLRPSVLQQGHLLISQGSLDRKLYFLESGSLKVDIKTSTSSIQLAMLEPGSVVGEGNFFSDLARNSSVVAHSECKVWELRLEDFSTLSKQHPTIALALSMALGAVLAARMLDLSKRFVATM